MKRYIRERAAAVAVALTCTAAGAADPTQPTAQDALLQSQIEVTWQDQAQGLAQLLADRLNVPYVAGRPLDARVHIQQANGGTVRELLTAINGQLPTGTSLQLVKGGTGPQLEVISAAPAGEVALVTPVATTPGGVPDREQVEKLFATPAQAMSWIEAARQSWKASFTAGATAQSAQPTNRWELQLKDITLSKAFARWAEAAGYRLKWDATKQVLIGGPDVFDMPFEEAITAALSTPGIQQSEYPLEVCFYPNTPPLARITLRGAQEKECK